MHVKKRAVIDNIEMAREIAREQFGDDSPKVVLKVAGLITTQEVKEELVEIGGSLLHPLEIHSK